MDFAVIISLLDEYLRDGFEAASEKCCPDPASMARSRKVDLVY